MRLLLAIAVGLGCGGQRSVRNGLIALGDWDPARQTQIFSVSSDGSQRGAVRPDGSGARVLAITNGDFGRASWQPVPATTR